MNYRKLSTRVIFSICIALFQYNDIMSQQIYPSYKRTQPQKRWEKMRLGMFVHFGMNTFNNGQDYDDNHSVPEKYNPEKLNVKQWVHTAKIAGMKYAVLTVKHSSGFCLWDSENYDYDIASSLNKTDVVAEFMKACTEEGIKPGFYYCILDAHNGNGWNETVKPEYFTIILKHLRELHTRYPGAIEQWIDIPNNLTKKQKDEIYQLVKSLNPTCLILMNQMIENSKEFKGSKVDPVCWPTDLMNTECFLPDKYSPIKLVNGKSYYLPLEHCDNGADNKNNADGSSAGNWFYTERYKLKTPEELLDLYKTCTERNTGLLLNIPPNKYGYIEEDIVKELTKMKLLIDKYESGKH